MHFAMCLDIKATGNRYAEISDHIWDNLLAKHKRARRLGNFFIVQVNSQDQWDSILSATTEYINEQPESIHFIMTPVMSGGKYNGILNKDDWDFINEITNN
jgi:hypothetical protein